MSSSFLDIYKFKEGYIYFQIVETNNNFKKMEIIKYVLAVGDYLRKKKHVKKKLLFGGRFQRC